MISHETYYRLSKSVLYLRTEYNKHSRDRERRIYWINDMLRRHARYVSRACKEAKIPMAKKAEKFKFNGYVNVSIPASEVNRAEKFIADDKNVFMMLGQSIVDGYKIACKFDEDNESIVATATCFDADSPNFGYVMSSFGGDWYTAVAALLFKHYELTDEDWSSFVGNSGNRFG